jgi:hypothetical protein
MYSHLDQCTLQYLDLTKAERITHIKKNRWIGYDHAKKLILKMEDLLRHPDTHRMPNLLIKAATNNGKSSILNRFADLHPVKDDPFEDKLVMPVLTMQIPSAPTPDSIYNGILRKLRLPFRESYSKDLKFQMVLDGLKNFDVRMLCFDELHVIANTTKLVKLQLLDTIKYLSNETRIPIVGAGTIEAHVLLLSDGQLANRFEPYLLPQWKPNDEFQQLVVSFEALLPLKRPSNLHNEEMAMRIYAETDGWIGEVHAYLARAAEYAIEKDIEYISMKVLDKIEWLSPTKRRIVA